MNKVKVECKHAWNWDWPWEMVHLKDWFYMVNSAHIHLGEGALKLNEIVFMHVRIFGLHSVWNAKITSGDAGSKLAGALALGSAMDEMSRSIYAAFGVPASALKNAVIGVDQATPGAKDETVFSFVGIDGTLHCPATDENIDAFVGYAFATGQAHVLSPELLARWGEIKNTLEERDQP